MYSYETKRLFHPDIKNFDDDLPKTICRLIFKGKRQSSFYEENNSNTWDNIIKINEVSI